MKYDPSKHHRRSIRLKGYDYSRPGAYFITLVTRGRACLFGEVVDGEMRLNEIGHIVAGLWQCLPVSFPKIRLDGFVVMPNHVHGIISILDGRGSAIGTQPGSLGAVIQNYKSVTARMIHQLYDMRVVPVWQRNYYEHIIRSQAELEKIVKYIESNPQKWEEDQLYTSAP